MPSNAVRIFPAPLDLNAQLLDDWWSEVAYHGAIAGRIKGEGYEGLGARLIGGVADFDQVKEWLTGGHSGLSTKHSTGDWKIK